MARELEVLRHVAGGMSNREIASILHLSETTIRNKLDLRNGIRLPSTRTPPGSRAPDAA